MDIDYIANELERVRDTDPFVGFAEAWVLLLQLALTEERGEDFERICDLLRRIPEDEVRSLLNSPHLAALIALDPPLESIIVSSHERMATIEVREAARNVTLKRDRAPRKAMNSAATILRVIRNKREHGFKSRSGPRDTQILGSAFPFLVSVLEICIAVRRAEAAGVASAESGG